MHRVLLVSDVLLQVFMHFSQLESRNLLAALARTCKAFHEPAMYFLWAEIDGLRPLLGCVTRLHPMINTNRANKGLTWIRDQGIEPLSAQEACQFLRHAARVRSLRVTTDDNALLDLLTVLPNETCMFPRLLSLTWSVSTPNFGLYLRRFLSPILRRCDLYGTLALHPDMKFIATSCPVLENLSIVPKTRALLTAHEYSLLSTTVRSCERLVGLRCPPLDSAAWEHLSNLPTLVTVTIGDALREVHYPFNLENLNFAPFLNVTVLHFCAAPFVITDVITVMQHSEFPSLTSFRLHGGAPPWADIERLFCALSQCKAHHTLQDIMIACVISDEDLWDDFLPVIGHFLCFGQLRNLKIYIGANIYLDNDLLLQAMSSWPHIESLEIQGPGSHHHSPPVTFRGLLAALRLCPHLNTLRILVDTLKIDIDPNFESFEHTSLRTLSLGSWKTIDATDAGAIACIISSMFPRVYKVKDNFGVWGEVNRHLKLLAREGQQT